MAFQWHKEKITTQDGTAVEAVAPIIISASRSTDIPAFHARWFLNRIEAGYAAWTNPFNRKTQYVSLSKTRAIVFWSKNPAPLMPLLPKIDARGIGYYFQFTVNDYEAENLEPRVPPLEERLKTFVALSKRLGRERIIWRFDPLMLVPSLTVEGLLDRIARIGSVLAAHTNKLVFSFADIRDYRKVQNNLVRESKHFTKETVLQAELTEAQRHQVAKGLQSLHEKWRRENPDFEIATCAEASDLGVYGITHNKCIDDELLARLYPNDVALMDFLGVSPDEDVHPVQQDLFSQTSDQRGKIRKRRSLKDTGQRKTCGCIFSKDIGAYNTCGHLCAYCYANTSAAMVLKNLEARRSTAEGIVGGGP